MIKMIKNNSNLNLVSYSPEWKKYFEKEVIGLKKLLKNNFIKAHHIGSTSITSILAEPTLDILVEVHTLTGIKSFQIEFGKMGLALNEELDKEDNIHLIRLSPDNSCDLCHIHIYEKIHHED